MIKIENAEVVGLEHAIRGMRNPKNSWDRIDSGIDCTMDKIGDCLNNDYINCDDCHGYKIGPNDHKLMMDLAKGGPVHAKYRRMITVYLDITAPLYWWKEFDTYKVGTVANSCSTMHKIHAKEFTLDEFSHEHLFIEPSLNITFCLNSGEKIELQLSSLKYLETLIPILNCYRDLHNSTDDKDLKKLYWWQMIQLLPSSYNQKRTVMLNYEVLVGLYKWRKDHKLDEWRVFCEWIESLPYSELITGEIKKEEV